MSVSTELATITTVDTAGVCILQGEAGVAPTDEFHGSPFGSSRAAEYRLSDDGSTYRQDFIAWFSTLEVLSPAQLAAAPGAPAGCEPTWTDADGNERSASRVDIVSRDIVFTIATGVGGLDDRDGANVIVKESLLSQFLPDAFTTGLISPTTAHATNGPAGTDLFTIPTSTPIGTSYEATVNTNDAGSIGLHFGVNWAITATTFDLGGEPSVRVGRYFTIQSVAFTYRRYYTCAIAPPLRQNQRDDARQNQRTSQQLTVRQRGYL